jgi:hypothetical protein
LMPLGMAIFLMRYMNIVGAPGRQSPTLSA